MACLIISYRPGTRYSGVNADIDWEQGVYPEIREVRELRKGTFFDDDVWADHDDDCHGDPNSFDEDPDFADGFRWSCCETPEDNEGCMNTRHKAAVNVVQLTRPSKRKAEEEVPNMRM
ncbi:uncharacterized protein RAG0_18075 [Rhynchosporium agropyri]|uniref:Uncharacterized protein n=1 Tax=Rhynchosporium agropyri TaxID=914238 RepID=A0A1E1L864_9HELO|nr:uncharacterized protein RAG0_18075 [Rhynchosporium agropyri]